MAIGLSLAGMTACSDPDDVVTSVEYNRLFCPTELEAKVQNTTGVKLTWFAISAAEQYSIEIYADDADMTFSGTPISFTGTPNIVSARTECSWVLPAGTLEGETTYSVRVKAVSETMESKWAATTFETGTEQIFATPDATQIGKTWVTLSWPAGTAVTTLTVQKSGEVLQTINLTAADVAAGQKTVEGLNYESTYTFYIYNGEKQRGKIQVQTLPNYTPVTSCTELLDAIEAAEAGEVLMLTENKVYDFTDFAAMGKEEAVKSIKIDKDIVLNTNNNATIKGIYFQINGGASVELANITLDGAGGSGDQAFNYKEEGTYAKLYIHDAEIKNYTKGFFYINVAAVINDITINNCIIHDIECTGGDMFDSRSGGFNAFNLTNSTIYNSAKTRDFIRMDDASSKVTATPVITVDHCTLYDVGSGDANYRLLYVRFAGNTINWTNNVVANTNNKRGFSNQAKTNIPTFKNNFYFNTKNLVSADDTADATITFFDAEGTVVADNPFNDAANADFKVVNEKIQDKEAGDPRWLR
ncbi:MAG: DUF4957 domain-containing protein [Prevotella sp.]|nr:DUF4957 domain-containing protein [Prevotella sp.]